MDSSPHYMNEQCFYGSMLFCRLLPSFVAAAYTLGKLRHHSLPELPKKSTPEANMDPVHHRLCWEKRPSPVALALEEGDQVEGKVCDVMGKKIGYSPPTSEFQV